MMPIVEVVSARLRPQREAGGCIVPSGISGLSFDSPSLSLVFLPSSPALAVLVSMQGRFTRLVSEVSSFRQKIGLFCCCMAPKQLTRTRRSMVVRWYVQLAARYTIIIVQVFAIMHLYNMIFSLSLSLCCMHSYNVIFSLFCLLLYAFIRDLFIFLFFSLFSVYIFL